MSFKQLGEYIREARLRLAVDLTPITEANLLQKGDLHFHLCSDESYLVWCVTPNCSVPSLTIDEPEHVH